MKHTVNLRPASTTMPSGGRASTHGDPAEGDVRVAAGSHGEQVGSLTVRGAGEAEHADSPYRESPPRVVVKVDSGVTWVRRAGESHLWRHAPDLCDCVLQTLSAADLEAEGDFDFLWLAVAARRADYILLFGDSTQNDARRLGLLGTRCEVVCCGSLQDARRVARILALGGDTVLHESSALAVFSHWCCP